MEVELPVAETALESEPESRGGHLVSRRLERHAPVVRLAVPFEGEHPIAGQISWLDGLALRCRRPQQCEDDAEELFPHDVPPFEPLSLPAEVPGALPTEGERTGRIRVQPMIRASLFNRDHPDDG